MNRKELKNEFSKYGINLTTKELDKLLYNCFGHAHVMQKEIITARNIVGIKAERLIGTICGEKVRNLYVGFDYKIKDKHYSFKQNIRFIKKGE